NLESYRKSIWLPNAIGRPQPIEAKPRTPAPMSRSQWLRRRLQLRLTDWGLVNTFDNRAESVSARVFRELCDAAGLDCRLQELVNWNHGPSLTDCFSVVTPRDGQSRKPSRLFKNPHFMDEAERVRRTAELYYSVRS